MNTESIYVYEYRRGEQKTYSFTTQAVEVKSGKHSLYIYGKSDCYGETFELMVDTEKEFLQKFSLTCIR